MTHTEERIIGAVKNLARAEAAAQIRSLQTRNARLVRQRDAANARVKEYRAHVAKYQKDLVAIRAEVRRLRENPRALGQGLADNHAKG